MENQLTPNNSMILEIRELLENARKNVNDDSLKMIDLLHSRLIRSF